jgi:hypothetical protein
MVRAGTLLKSLVGGGPNSPVVIPVVDKSAFAGASNNNPVPVVFMHAPKYDGTGTRDRYFEFRRVIKASGSGTKQTITIDQPLNRQYDIDISSAPFYAGVPDGVGVYTPTTLSQLYFPDTALVPGLFGDAFVEYVILNAGPGTVNGAPYIPAYSAVFETHQREALTKKWCDVCDTGLPKNHQYLLGASTSTRPGQSNNGTVGETQIDHLNSVIPNSVVWVLEAEHMSTYSGLVSRCGTIPVLKWVHEIVAHELVHGWDVNPPTDSTGGHCSLKAWNSAQEECGMHTTEDASEDVCDRWDDIFALHTWTAASEYRRIRSQLEPLPQTRQR